MPPRLRWPLLASRRRQGTRQETRQTLATDEQAAPRQPPLATLQSPNERDTSAQAQHGPTRPIIRQAAKDVADGLEDTDCRGRVSEVVPEATAKKPR